MEKRDTVGKTAVHLAKGAVDLTGFDNGFYKVISFACVKNKRKLWNCKCKCGKVFQAKPYHIKSASIKSCGCSRKRVLRSYRWVKHGLRKLENGKPHPLYQTWSDMKTRCYNARRKADYRNYQGKGIKICDEWLNSVENFYNWSINNGWKNNLTIDRIDANKNYEPNNCQFITKSENTKRMLANRRTQWQKTTNQISLL